MEICRKLFESLSLDAVIVLSSSNTYYLSGFAASNCQIVITPSEQYFITDCRYINEASKMLKDRFNVINGDYITIKDLVKGANKIGWDSDIPYSDYRDLCKIIDESKLVDITKTIEQYRMFKSKLEIENIKKAQAITELGYNAAIKNLVAGVTEIEIASIIEYTFLRNGAQIAFDSIVAFGENGASPHAHRTNRVLKEGDFITMDIGAKWNGYCSDMTRTVALGGVSRKQVEIYNTVLHAQELAIKNIKTGMSGYEADLIAREFITQRGYGEYFTHSLGHSVGIDIHENICLSPRAKNDIISNGMVITVEPGIYIPNFCGVRIEDTVLIENDKANSLASIDKKLLII